MDIETNGQCCVEEKEKINKNEEVSTPPNINVLHEDVKDNIKQYLENQGYTNITIKVELGSNLGDNFLGFIGKLTITCTNNEKEQKEFHWIVKTAPNLSEHRRMMAVDTVYAREAHVYENIFTLFQQFQHEKNILEPFEQHAGFILSYLNLNKESIVMNDMKHIGYVMRNRKDPLDLNHVKLVVKSYAKLHAISYALKDQKIDVFNKLVESTKDIISEFMFTEEQLKNQTRLNALALEALDPVKDEKVLSGYQKYLDTYKEVLPKLLKDTNNNRFVIGHGDSWVNNMLWKYDTNICSKLSVNDVPKNVCLLDWQMARYGSPACDLSYFIFTCTTKELRDKHYDEIIKLYYYTLCAHSIELGTNPEKYLTFDGLQEELKRYSLIGLFTTVMVLTVITRDTNEIPEWREKGIDSVAEELFMTKSKNANEYNERVRGVLVDYYEKGYFDVLL
ncbi:uncharacterized protein [Onthophagus taurus]|uniref:uncharacterized protein n=1 Tax=Onthophagus taurus TaxID=166361 RepID=UPI0039BE4959